MNRVKFWAVLKEAGISKAEMARKLGLSKNGFTSKSNGASDFKLAEVRRMVKILGLNPEQVFDLFFEDSK